MLHVLPYLIYGSFHLHLIAKNKTPKTKLKRNLARKKKTTKTTTKKPNKTPKPVEFLSNLDRTFI